jgi:hypothetical protein
MNRTISVLLITLLLSTPLCFAQLNSTDSFTITTYYPAPHGYYRGLEALKLAVGDTNNDGNLNSADLPNRSGDIRFTPQPDDPNAWTVGEKGQLAYSASNDAFYYSNGNKWVAQAGGGTVVISLACSWRYDYREGVVNIGEATNWGCTPPACPDGWTSVGISNEVQSVACSGGGVCIWDNISNPNYHPLAVGQSVRVCVKN